MFHLIQRGARVVSFDISEDRHRLDLLMDGTQQAAITYIKGDLTDRIQVAKTVSEQAVTHIIHLGALQVPFCRENPVLGAQVNVVGTLNVFEAAHENSLNHVVYASSVAVYGNPGEYPPGPIGADALMNPHTLYGGYKQCNEQNARLYANDYHVNSTALRPYIVYGVGRDQGMTSDPTKAMRAAAIGESYHIGFGGTAQFQFASDVARQFIAAADHPLDGACVFNLGGMPTSMQTVVSLVQEYVPEANITYADKALPFPDGFDDTTLRGTMPEVYQTPLEEGIRQTIDHFRRIHHESVSQ